MQTLTNSIWCVCYSDRLLGHLRKLSPKKSGKSSAEDSLILIFALYKKEASRVEDMLRRKGFSVGALHGDMSQTARMDALANFKNGTTGLLVATDVAARGLDIPNVAAVINYTFPLTIEDYIHRIGRTGASLCRTPPIVTQELTDFYCLSCCTHRARR